VALSCGLMAAATLPFVLIDSGRCQVVRERCEWGEWKRREMREGEGYQEKR
jgi:hypothetical protein